MVLQEKLLQAYNSLDNQEEALNDELPGFFDPEYVETIFSMVESKDIDEVWVYKFIEEYCMGGGGDAAMFWGIKR